MLLLCFHAGSSAAMITTIKPLTLIANEVTRGIEQPQQLLADGISAHDYALRPSERLRIQQAELVIWVGNSHESFLRSLLKNNSNQPRNLIYQQAFNMAQLRNEFSASQYIRCAFMVIAR